MNLFQFQPTFTVDVPVDQERAIARLKTAIASEELHGFAESAGMVIDFKIAPAERRFWSPHLSAQCGETEDGARIFARFSPRPEVWTMFIAIYFVVAILICLAMIVGYVQWSLGYAPWSLVAVPIGLLLIAGLHAASLIGQQLSADQMTLLRSRLDRAIEIAFGDGHK
ncbi:hypothetical protein [Allorhodopirellula heiligendammensis]|mgnify:CR=1 FL=1|uniref:Uncharacterized protein n=1 Tax=Allorhodopirellula heiligendammensis TaxID=2714739 RepID=A0A5C6BZG4_9BACT|nr:hypothetical protein [Allorhodopirellula heiligendammensis]TWU16811.1 hypothetical protein Poly21_40180 [Allorhodopirellula heiligendammensis]